MRVNTRVTGGRWKKGSVRPRFAFLAQGGTAVLNGILGIALVMVSAEAGIAEAMEVPGPPATVHANPPAAVAAPLVDGMPGAAWHDAACLDVPGVPRYPCTASKQTCCAWWSSTCDMHQHLRYPPPLHGNYYFRPYDPTDLFRQQAFVMQWGGDPRNPYGNQIFDRIHGPREVVESPGAAEAVPLPPPTTLLPGLPGGDD